MFDVAPSEFILFALVALVVIGPKDLPKAMRVVGRFVGKARGMARHFRSGFDAMVREAELEEMEKKWKEENERIMREHATLTDAVVATEETPAALPAPEVSSVSSAQAAIAASREARVAPGVMPPVTNSELPDMDPEPPVAPEEKAA